MVAYERWSFIMVRLYYDFLYHKKNTRPGLTVWVVKFVKGFIALYSFELWPERVLSMI